MLAILATSGCGLKEEAQWQDAGEALEFFANSASQQALADSEVASLSLSCEALLPAARESLDEPGSAPLRELIQVCADEGLGFGSELRCEDGRLQVRCL